MGGDYRITGPTDPTDPVAGDTDWTWDSVARRFARWVVRYRSRRLGLIHSPWVAVPAVVAALLFLGYDLVVLALPGVPGCAPEDLEFTIDDGAVGISPTSLTALFVVFVLVVPTGILVAADRWAKHRKPVWTRVVQGTALRLSAVVVLTLSAGFGWVARDLYGRACREVPLWVVAVVALGLIVGVLLAAMGTARRDQAGWVGFALVVNGDLAAAAVLTVVALGDNDVDATERLFLMAFALHATCVLVAARWAYSVAEHPGSRAVDRAKAGEAGRALAALWTLMSVAVLASAVLEGTTNAGSDELIDLLKTPIVVALTWGGLLATTASGFTKYVEGREGAAKRLGISQWRQLPTYRDRRMARAVVRMLAALGPLPLSVLRAGVDHLEPDRVRQRVLLRALRVTGCAVEVDGLWTATHWRAPWPADEELLRRARRAGFPSYSRREMFALLAEVGDADLPRATRVLKRHPLLDRSTRGRWRVVDADSERALAAEARQGRLLALRRVITPRRTAAAPADDDQRPERDPVH